MTTSRALAGEPIDQPRVLIVDDDPALLQALPAARRIRMSDGVAKAPQRVTAARR